VAGVFLHHMQINEYERSFNFIFLVYQIDMPLLGPYAGHRGGGMQGGVDQFFIHTNLCTHFYEELPSGYQVTGIIIESFHYRKHSLSLSQRTAAAFLKSQ
jgi:hypothetical protein